MNNKNGRTNLFFKKNGEYEYTTITTQIFKIAVYLPIGIRMYMYTYALKMFVWSDLTLSLDLQTLFKITSYFMPFHQRHPVREAWVRLEQRKRVHAPDKSFSYNSAKSSNLTWKLFSRSLYMLNSKVSLCKVWAKQV